MDNYVFFPNLDYIGCDICCLNGKSIENIKEYCNLNNECVAFNTFGYVKYYVDKNKFAYVFNDKNDGIYVNIERVKQLSLLQNDVIDGFTYYPNICINDSYKKFILSDLKELSSSLCTSIGFTKTGHILYKGAEFKFTDNTLFGSYIKNDYCSHIDNMIMNYNNNNTNNTNN